MTETSLFVFGDSLSDTGNSFQFTQGLIPPAPFYFNGRFSNGPVAVDLLPTLLGVTLQPANNFAFGGATTGRGNSNEDDLGVDLPGLRDQIEAFTAIVGAGGADAAGLYLVWAGPNNFLDTLGGSVVADPAALLQQGTIDLVDAVQTLNGLGAEQIVLPNMVNLGRLPASREFSREATAITKAFNASVALAIGNLNFSVTAVDLFKVGEEIAADPARFNFTNVTDPLLFRLFDPTLPPPTNPSEFFFWDQFHPTQEGHAIFADVIAKIVTNLIPQPQFNRILGTDRSDWRFGSTGDDDMDGLAGSDFLFAGAGNDRIEGWSGHDQLFGGQGDDILSGGEGYDAIWGGEGADIGFGGAGYDWLFGEIGDDILVGDAGGDWINGGQGNDYLLGGADDDLLWGDHGDDIVNGGSESDRIWGGQGNDQLDGGTEADRLTGGAGNDRFVYRFGNGFDQLMDFVQGQDQIDLTSFEFANFTEFLNSILRLVGINASNLSEADVLLA
ncbi:MAG: SGNH/GDSL hydrolase family protein [Elainella sp. Prado103]|nr:SGNH/GDSL hydrolase family protein [Elainella sp. Prado103]